MSKISPFLWFNDQAEEAAMLYTSLFPNSKITNVARYAGGSPGEPGKVMTVEFEIDGQRVTALNGGDFYTLSPAFSFSIDCEDQAEVDRLWQALSANGGEAVRCGWLRDRFGVSWQIVPTALPKYLGGPDRAGAQRAMAAMLGMVKLDIEGLRRAYEGKP